MAWENEGRYYTRSRRVCGLVVRQYVDSGDLGALGAFDDAKERFERKLRRALQEAEHDSDKAQEKAMTDYFKGVDAALAESLLAAGYHQHKGQWRRRRGTKESSNEPGDK